MLSSSQKIFEEKCIKTGYFSVLSSRIKRKDKTETNYNLYSMIKSIQQEVLKGKKAIME